MKTTTTKVVINRFNGSPRKQTYGHLKGSNADSLLELAEAVASFNRRGWKAVHLLYRCRMMEELQRVAEAVKESIPEQINDMKADEVSECLLTSAELMPLRDKVEAFRGHRFFISHDGTRTSED